MPRFPPPAALAALERWSKFDLPDNVRFSVQDNLRRYGRLRLHAGEGGRRYLTTALLRRLRLGRRKASRASAQSRLTPVFA